MRTGHICVVCVCVCVHVVVFVCAHAFMCIHLSKITVWVGVCVHVCIVCSVLCAQVCIACMSPWYIVVHCVCLSLPLFAFLFSYVCIKLFMLLSQLRCSFWSCFIALCLCHLFLFLLVYSDQISDGGNIYMIVNVLIKVLDKWLIWFELWDALSSIFCLDMWEA